MEWSKELTLKLIEVYRSKTILWDNKHPNHYNKKKKNDAWEELAEEFGTTTDECKRKINNLLSGLRREKYKMKHYNMNTESEYSDAYESNWFAFKSLLFLWDKNNVEETPSNNEGGPQPSELNDEFVKNIFDDMEIKQEKIERDRQVATRNEICKRMELKRNRQAKSQIRKRMEIAAKRKRRADASNSFEISKEAPHSAQQEETECKIFGNLVAKKLSKYSEKLQSAVQLDIMKILFEADSSHFSNK